MKKRKIGEIVSITKGRKAQNVLEEKLKDAVRYIQIEDLRTDNKLQYTTDTNGVFVSEGDLCIAWDGANAGTVSYGLSGVIGSTIAKLSITDSEIETQYVGRFLQSKFNILNGKTTGTTIPHIERRRLEELELPRLPPAEQRRIAAILDKADTIRRKRQQSLELVDSLLKSVFLDMFGDPVTNPKGWEIVPLMECLSSIENGTSPVCDSLARTKAEPAILKLSAVTSGNYNEHENKRMLEGTKINVKSEVQKYDLLMVRKNTYELVGMCAFVFDTSAQLFMPDLIFRLCVKDNVCKEFLWILFNNTSFHDGIKKLAGGSSGSMPNISKQRLLDLRIPLPPIPIQNKFTSIVQEKHTYRKRLVSMHDEADNAFKSLQQSFFG